MAEAHDTAAALVAALREHAPDADISPVGSLRRGCETCGDLDILAAGAPAVADGRVHRLPARRARPRARRHQVERAAVGRLPGRPAARAAREPRRRAAVLHRLEGRTTSRCAIARSSAGFKLNEYGLYPDRRRQRGRGRDGGGASTRRSASRSSRRSCARTAARSKRPSAARCPAWSTLGDLRGDLHMHTTATDGRADAETMARAARGRRPRLHRDHRSQPGARDGQRPRRAPRARARAPRSAS